MFLITVLLKSSFWVSSLRLILSNDVEKNPGPKSPNKKPDPARKAKLKRSKSSVRDSGVSSASSGSIPDEALTRKLEEVNTDSDALKTPDIFKDDAVNDDDSGKVKHLEAEIESLQSQLQSVDQNVEKLLNSIETLRPLYNQAKEALNSLSNQHQKNNLVFHGIKPDKLEV